jgi:hypothetical protein
MANFRARSIVFWGDFPGIVGDVNALAGAIETHVQGALAAGGSGITATSATSLTVGTGVKVLTISVGKAFAAGQYVVLWSEAGQAGMLGRITVSNTATGSLAVDVADTVGGGTYAVWDVIVVPLVAAQVDLSGGHFTGAPVSVGAVARRLRDDVGRFVGVIPPAFQIFAPDMILPGTVAFSRASSGWRLGAAGIVRETAAGVPRFEFDASGALRGLLIEGAATRLNTIAAAPTAPENVAVTAQAYTLSFYGTGSVTLSGAHAATVAGAGALPVRRSYTFTPTAGTLTLTPSGTVQNLQVETGPVATSPILGEGSQVVRAADVATVTLSGIEWNASQGALVVDAAAPASAAAGAYHFLVSIDDGTSANRICILRNAAGMVFMQVWIAGSVAVSLASTGSVPAGGRVRVGGSWSQNAFVCVVNGEVLTAGAGNVPTGLTTLRLGAHVTTGYAWQAPVRQLAYFPRPLSAAQLVAITR